MNVDSRRQHRHKWRCENSMRTLSWPRWRASVWAPHMQWDFTCVYSGDLSASSCDAILVLSYFLGSCRPCIVSDMSQEFPSDTTNFGLNLKDFHGFNNKIADVIRNSVRPVLRECTAGREGVWVCVCLRVYDVSRVCSQCNRAEASCRPCWSPRTER